MLNEIFFMVGPKINLKYMVNKIYTRGEDDYESRISNRR
jgi:hypothetical protein